MSIGGGTFSWRLSCPLLALAVGAAVATPVEAQEWKRALEVTLDTAYPLSKRATLAPDRITHQGVVLVVRKEGIAADPSSDARYSVTNVRGGQIGEAGGAVAAMLHKRNTRVFRSGERVYLTGIKVDDRFVQLLIMSVDMFELVERGSTRQTRYKAALRFEFPEGWLASADQADVKAAIEAVLAPEGDANASTVKTISVGQTTEEVERILGAPQRKVELGERVIYFYPDMKITFVAGRVTDIQ